jgi:hypothetical protein
MVSTQCWYLMKHAEDVILASIKMVTKTINANLNRLANIDFSFDMNEEIAVTA